MSSLKFAAASLGFAALLAASQTAAQIAPSPFGPNHESHAAPPPDAQTSAPSMMERHQEMMMADMKALDAKIKELAARMNSEQGEGRLDAVVQLVNAMLEKQTVMQQCMAMHGQMPPMPGQMRHMPGPLPQMHGPMRGGEHPVLVP